MSVMITILPPCKAAVLGAKSRNIHTQTGPITVSNNISIPTSAAGIRFGPNVINMNANGTIIRQRIVVHIHWLPLSMIESVVRRANTDMIIPPPIKVGTIEKCFSERSLTNLHASANPQTNASRSPLILGLCQESSMTQIIPSKQNEMAIQVISGDFSLRKTRESTAANKGCTLMITNAFATEVKLMAITKQMELTAKSKVERI